MSRRQSALGLFDFTTEFLDGTVILTDVLALLLLVQLDEVVHDTLIEIFTTQMSITVGGNDLEDTIVDGQQRNIESTASQVKDQNVLLSVLLIQAISDGGGCRLVDDTHNVQT